MSTLFQDVSFHSSAKCSLTALSTPDMISCGNSPIRLISLFRSNVLILLAFTLDARMPAKRDIAGKASSRGG
jgi:hypothetical protein